jgi:hypothetical protein
LEPLLLVSIVDEFSLARLLDAAGFGAALAILLHAARQSLEIIRRMRLHDARASVSHASQAISSSERCFV